ncbi:MAG: TonB-dependent receptor [Niastella sp.]|nr:TonB-dependent receptor [Niastella sp.]
MDMKKTQNRKRFIQLRLMLVLLTCFAGTVAFAQNTVKGKVTTGTGEPVANASVVVKGTTVGTNTADDGTYTIAATKGATLVISSVNYTTKEVRVGDDNTINIELAAAAGNLDQVIVVGYGTQRKEAVTGSVASIGGDKLRDVPSPNISQALQGRLPGVDISQTSTRPGATTQIRIRGTRSLSASNDPLIVLDGIPFIGSLADINPNDIKSVDILKDASATAIYGSRGANGVILITTDKGNRNRKPRISYNTYTGAQKVFAKYPMMNGPEFAALRAARGQYGKGADEADGVNTDWQDLFYQTGIVTDHSISLSGGTETGSYNFGAGYYLNEGVVPTQQYKRYSLRGSLDQQVGKFVRFGFTTNTNYNQSEGNQVGLYNTLSMSPLASPYNADGTPKRSIQMADNIDNQYVTTKDVVKRLRDNDQWISETRGFASYNAIYGEVKAPFLDGLKYRVNLGLDYVQVNGGNYTGPGVNNGANPASVSSASVDNRHTYHWTLENILTYDKTFGKHTVNAVALYSAEQNKYNRSNMSAQDIPVDAFQFYNLGQAAGQLTIDPANQDYQLWGLQSAMGRVMYSYDNRYMISATVRSDASSRLAPGRQWHTYPAVSVGWNISNESFMQNVPVINNLKLRAGFGQTSNQAVGVYSTLGQLATRPYNFGPSSYSIGYYVSQLPNASLGWEYSKTWNFGLDFSLLKNRLSGTIEYYITKTEDILLGLGLPPTSGVSSITSNIGATQNKGIELALNGVILDNHNGWTWEAGVNFYANRNKLVSLASGQTRDENNWWFVGHNINAIFDYKKIGLWQDHDPYFNILEPSSDSKLGMIKVQYTGTYNADGTPTRAIGAADRQVMDVDPDWQGGFNTRVAYKGFDLGIVGIFRHGGILFSTIHGSNGYLNLLTGRRNNIKVDYWTPTNTNAKYPNPAGPISSDNQKYASTLSYFDGSFMKVRTITLGHDFNQSLMKRSNVKLRMYFTVQNPFVMFSPFHKESGLDPETNSFGNENAAANLSQNLRRILTVGFNTPSTRNYIVGVNVTF